MAVRSSSRRLFEPHDGDEIAIRYGHEVSEVSFKRVRLASLALTFVSNNLIEQFAGRGNELTTEELLGVLARRELQGTGE